MSQFNTAGQAYQCTLRRFVLCALCALFGNNVVVAQDTAGPAAFPPDARNTPAAASAQRAASLRIRLQELTKQIAEKQAAVKALLAAKPGIGAAENLSTSDAITARADALREEIVALHKTFAQLATGGVDETIFDDEPVEKFDWQAEIIDISRPIFDGLKGLTERPRQLERLRREIDRGIAQRTAAEGVLKTLASIDRADITSATRERLTRVETEWRNRAADSKQAIEVAKLQLDGLLNTEQPLLEQVRSRAIEFARGRGLTLLIALLAATAAWLAMQAIRSAVERHAKRKRGKEIASTRFRVMLYAHRLITIAVVAVSMLATFYMMGDILLLALMIIAIVMAILSLRRLMPKFLAEARLLLGIGEVREGERVVFNGLPYEVRSLNVFSVLRNPRLEGIVRLPIHSLAKMQSRPAKDEPWFPTTTGDFVLLPDERFARTIRQTQDFVQLEVRGAQVFIPSLDFVGQQVRNLSAGETFIVPIIFGIDYAHQAISLTDVAPKFTDAVESALRAESYGEDLVKVAADFKEAGTSSLDYLVLATMNSAAAPSYVAITRKIHQACVATCNREGWGIPFAQLTIHHGEGFEALRSDGAVSS